MAIATIESTQEPAPDRVVVRPARRHRRGRATASFVAGAVAVVLVGLGGYATVRSGDRSSASIGSDASSITRGRAADSARLEAAAAAYFTEQAKIARGRAADAARVEAAADAFAERGG